MGIGTADHFTETDIGRIKLIAAQLTAIIRREQTEISLEESEARYRSIVEDQTEFVTRWKHDGTLAFANEPYCRYWGQTEEQLIGNSLFRHIHDCVDLLFNFQYTKQVTPVL